MHWLTNLHNLGMSTLILINPHAAGGRARRLLLPLDVWLTALGLAQKPDIVMPESLHEAHHEIAKRPYGSKIVVVGGDGTLNQMLPSLISGKHVIGLVPYGSGNDCARAWGLHKLSWQDALYFALNGSASAIDVGRIHLNHLDSHYFHSSLAVGFDASVGNRALAGPKFLRGLPRYLLATLRELLHLKNWPLKVRADGHMVHEGVCLLASSLNTPTYGGGMPAVPHAMVNDGQLNLLVGGRFNRWQTLLMLPRLLIGKHLGHARIQCVAFTEATLTCPVPVPVAADGETLGFATHIQITLLPGALQVVKKT
jgi:diacylglycerol kinase (ATP)